MQLYNKNYFIQNMSSFCNSGQLKSGFEISVSPEGQDLLFFLDRPVEFLKISMEKVQILRKWVFRPAYALL